MDATEVLLAQWRDAESRLAQAKAEGSPEQVLLQRRVTQLRHEYNTIRSWTVSPAPPSLTHPPAK